MFSQWRSPLGGKLLPSAAALTPSCFYHADPTSSSLPPVAPLALLLPVAPVAAARVLLLLLALVAAARLLLLLLVPLAPARLLLLLRSLLR